VPREGEYTNQPPGPVPTVGDAVVALREVQGHLSQSLLEVDAYSIKLLNQDSTGMDELEEVCAEPLHAILHKAHLLRRWQLPQWKELID
jgi:hypothetical protein